MNPFTTYEVKVTFEMVTHSLNYGNDDYKKAVYSALLHEMQNKIRLALLDNKDFLFTNPELTALEKQNEQT